MRSKCDAALPLALSARKLPRREVLDRWRPRGGPSKHDLAVSLERSCRELFRAPLEQFGSDGVLETFQDSIGKRFCVAHRHQRAEPAIVQDFARTTFAVGTHHRKARVHGL